MAIFLLLIVVIILVGASTSFGAMGIVVGLFADVLALVYFFGMTVQVFLIGWVAFMAGLLVFTLVSTSATHSRSCSCFLTSWGAPLGWVLGCKGRRSRRKGPQAQANIIEMQALWCDRGTIIRTGRYASVSRLSGLWDRRGRLIPVPSNSNDQQAGLESTCANSWFSHYWYLGRMVAAPTQCGGTGRRSRLRSRGRGRGLTAPSYSGTARSTIR